MRKRLLVPALALVSVALVPSAALTVPLTVGDPAPPLTVRGFVIDTQGRIAWIGYPLYMDRPLARIVAGDWDMVAEARRMREKQAAQENRDAAPDPSLAQHLARYKLAQK